MSSTIQSFQELQLHDTLLKALEEIGYEAPSPIQAASIPPLLEGRDILGQAQTGTGKTAAFALPLLNRLDFSLQGVQTLVLTPTRELSIQVAEAFQSYARHMENFHVLPVYGGQDIRTQLKMLKRNPQVVVGTPGRLKDHLMRGTLSLDHINSFVLDEADEMLRMGFIDDVEWILEHTPETRQVALFSATMPEPIRRVAKRHLKDPVEVKIKSDTVTVDSVEQFYLQVGNHQKLEALTRILEGEDFDAAIVFVRTKTQTMDLALKLEARGHACAALSGDVGQARREQIIDELKECKLDVVIATDVAARGLDVKRITHVVNYDLPGDAESYVHRIGRTGRAGRKGRAILFVTNREMRMLHVIERATRKTLEHLNLMSLDDITTRRIENFKRRIVEGVQQEDHEFFLRIVRETALENEMEMDQVAAVLARMLQKDRPLRPEGLNDTLLSDVTSPRGKRDRKERETGRNQREEKSRGPGLSMERYRMEVGENQGATTREIVGAIANEAGIDGRFINNVRIYDDYSTVDLPEGMPREVLQHLKKVRVCHLPLRLSLHEEELHGGENGGRPGPVKRRHTTGRGKPGFRSPSRTASSRSR